MPSPQFPDGTEIKWIEVTAWENTEEQLTHRTLPSLTDYPATNRTELGFWIGYSIRFRLPHEMDFQSFYLEGRPEDTEAMKAHILNFTPKSALEVPHGSS